MDNKIKITNLPKNYTQNELIEKFQIIGDIIKVIKNKRFNVKKNML
jgi:hypothetical protein